MAQVWAKWEVWIFYFWTSLAAFWHAFSRGLIVLYLFPLNLFFGDEINCHWVLIGSYTWEKMLWEEPGLFQVEM